MPVFLAFPSPFAVWVAEKPLASPDGPIVPPYHLTSTVLQLFYLANNSLRRLISAIIALSKGVWMIQGVGLNLAWYLFLSGMGAGGYLLASLARVAEWHRGEAFQYSVGIPRGRSHFVAQVVCIALVLFGALFLYADLSVPKKFLYVFLNLGQSIISFGAWALLLFFVFAVARIAARSCLPHRLSTDVVCGFLGVAACLAAATICIYTGVYLYELRPAVPFWGSPLIVCLLVASAMGTGASALTMISFLAHSENRVERLRWISLFDFVVKALELVLLLGFLFSRISAGGKSSILAYEFAFGAYAPGVWFLVVFVGIVVPMVASIFARKPENEIAYLVSSLCGTVGGFALRCCIILV